MEILVLVGLAFLLLVFVPLLVLGLFLKVIFWIVLIPFRVVAALFGVAAGAVAVLAKLMFVGLALLFGLGLLLGAVVLIPLLALLFIVVGIGLLVRAARPRHAPVAHRAQ